MFSGIDRVHDRAVFAQREERRDERRREREPDEPSLYHAFRLLFSDDTTETTD